MNCNFILAKCLIEKQITVNPLLAPSLISPSFSGEETPSLLSPFFRQPYYSSLINNRLYKPVTEKLHLNWSGDGTICFWPQLQIDLQLLVLKLFHLKRIFGKHLVNIIAFNLLKQWFVIKCTIHVGSLHTFTHVNGLHVYYLFIIIK